MNATQSAASTFAGRGDNKHDRILDAALEVFARKGFHEAKVSEIARVAGVADGTIYLYFKNKDDLLISLFEVELAAINEGLKSELSEIEDPFERVERFVRYHLRLAQRSPRLAAFITIELRRSSKFIKDYGKGQLTQYLDQLGRVIDEGKHRGAFDPALKSGVLKHLVFGALDHACMVWVTNPQGKPEDLDEVGDQLVALLRSSMRPHR